MVKRTLALAGVVATGLCAVSPAGAAVVCAQTGPISDALCAGVESVDIAGGGTLRVDLIHQTAHRLEVQLVRERDGKTMTGPRMGLSVSDAEITPEMALAFGQRLAQQSAPEL